MNIPAPEIAIYPDRATLSHAAAERFVAAAARATADGRFTVALSGGSTPRDLYADLASDEFRGRIEWGKCYFFWGDERAVPPDDPQSNYRMANETLLSRVPVPRENIFRIHAESPPKAAAQAYEQTLKEFFQGALPRFDLVLLGLGSNGHTASLFPFTTVVREQKRWCVSVLVDELKTVRITLTAPVLNAGRQVMFLVAGDDKAETVREVLQGPYQPDRLPAQLIRPSGGELVWLIDKAAAAQIQD